MTEIFDIYIEQGTDWSQTFPIYDPVNLNGASAAMQIRMVNGATFIAGLNSNATGGLVIDPATNTITAALSNALTAAFIPGSYAYDIKVADADNKYYRAIQGIAFVSEQITIAAPPQSTGVVIATEDGISITTEDGQKITT